MAFFRTILRLSAACAVVAALAGLGYLGWRWMMATPAGHIEVVGARHAEADTLLAIARVDTGMRLVDIEPHLVEDRLRRHPWVEEASVARRPTGTVMLRVEERTPAALRLDSNGRPDYYLDPYGFMMPHVRDTSYNVPLLRDFPAAFHPSRPIEHEPLRELLGALGRAPEGVEAMISDVEWREPGDVWVMLTPPDDDRTVPVRMGRGDFEAALKRLEAFYEQALRTQPVLDFEWIDVRFESQVVTREREGRE